MVFYYSDQKFTPGDDLDIYTITPRVSKGTGKQLRVKELRKGQGVDSWLMDFKTRYHDKTFSVEFTLKHVEGDKEALSSLSFLIEQDGNDKMKGVSKYFEFNLLHN